MSGALRCLLRISLFALVAGGSVVATLAPAQDRPDVDSVDRLFERWDRVDTPGMTIAILRDGKAADTRSYGMASIEHSIPNAPQTAYPLASVSKQFTAFAIHLLVGDGKLSLTDDVRKYVPELPDHGDPITLEMLIHHTSGLRETSGLLDLQGYGPQDAVSRQQALDLLWRQRTLNARPGSEYLYSNSGYLLLGLVIERVSGMSLGDFWQRRISNLSTWPGPVPLQRRPRSSCVAHPVTAEWKIATPRARRRMSCSARPVLSPPSAIWPVDGRVGQFPCG